MSKCPFLSKDLLAIRYLVIGKSPFLSNDLLVIGYQ